MANRFGGSIVLGAIAVALSSAAHAVDVVGRNAATLAWTPASGPVSGYYVVVARDSRPSQVESISSDPRESVQGAYGETLLVRVAAFGADGVAGPLSESSQPIRFVAAAAPSAPAPDGGDSVPPASDAADSGGTRPHVARDFNGDGTADLVVRDVDKLRVWAMRGAHVAAEIPLPLPPTGAQLVGTGDYDGNGVSDLLWENSRSGEITLWQLDGGVVLRAGVLDRSSLPLDQAWHVGGSGDLDGDGADEVLWFSRVRGEVEVWALSGSSIASRTRFAGHTGAWSVIAVADTDGAGDAEVVWQGELDRVLERRDPDATDPQHLGNLAADWRIRGAVDLDGDGAAELVVQQVPTGATQAWTLDRSGIAGARNLANAIALGSYSGGGDYDGDGREDIAWSDTANGAVTLWLATSGAPVAALVDRALPANGRVVSGATGSDDGEFLDRFCSPDLDGGGQGFLNSCLGGSRKNDCEAADLDGDRAITPTDAAIFRLRLDGQTCQDR